MRRGPTSAAELRVGRSMNPVNNAGGRDCAARSLGAVFCHRPCREGPDLPPQWVVAFGEAWVASCVMMDVTTSSGGSCSQTAGPSSRELRVARSPLRRGPGSCGSSPPTTRRSTWGCAGARGSRARSSRRCRRPLSPAERRCRWSFVADRGFDSRRGNAPRGRARVAVPPFQARCPAVAAGSSGR
jgi:hypothetical protein